MPIVAEYLPPGAPREAAAAPCCSSCASPEERAAAETRGQALVRAALARRRMAGNLGADEDEELPLLASPSWFQAYYDKARGEVWANAQDYSRAIRAGAIDQALLGQFKEFFNEFERWYAGLGWSDRYISFVAHAAGLLAQDFRRRNRQWRDLLQSRGVKPTAPAPNIAPPPSSAPSEIPSVIKWVAGGAIAIGGAIALGHLAKGARLLKAAT